MKDIHNLVRAEVALDLSTNNPNKFTRLTVILYGRLLTLGAQESDADSALRLQHILKLSCLMAKPRSLSHHSEAKSHCLVAKCMQGPEHGHIFGTQPGCLSLPSQVT